MSTNTKPTGIVLMTYGSATTSADVQPYFTHIYKNPSDELVEEFKRRFDVVGSSPLVQITIDQAAALEQLLAERVGEGKYVVEAGMLHSAPFIDEAVGKLRARGAGRVLGLLMSPQYSPHIMRGYDQALAAAGEQHGFDPEAVTMLGQWSTEPKFIQMQAENLLKMRTELKTKYGQDVPVVFTTHSLPERVVKRDPSYLDQLSATTAAVAKAAKLAESEYQSAYQSAGHTPEEWLKPDLNDVIADLKTQKVPAVIVVPIQFLADHLEILYDLDTAAREETEGGGVHYHRLPVANLEPLFIEALADITLRVV